MKFGIFYELQLPRPWTQSSEYDLFQQALAQMELADALDYDYVWMVEHHFLEEYSHCSAPEVFLGAASQRTKRMVTIEDVHVGDATLTLRFRRDASGHTNHEVLQGGGALRVHWPENVTVDRVAAAIREMIG